MLGTYAETMAQLGEMRTRFDAGFSTSDRAILDELHLVLFERIITLTGCSDCYRDAYIMIVNKLKKDGKMPQEVNYKLKAGILINKFGAGEFYMGNVSDEVAEEYLHTYPERYTEFQIIPDDWAKRVAKRYAEDKKKSSGKKSESKKKVETSEAEKPTETKESEAEGAEENVSAEN